MSVCIWHLGGGWTTHLKNISQIGSSHQVVVKMTNIWNHQLGHYWWIALKHEVVDGFQSNFWKKYWEVSHHFRVSYLNKCDFHRLFFLVFFFPSKKLMGFMDRVSFPSADNTRTDTSWPIRTSSETLFTRLSSEGKEGKSRWPTLVGWKKPTRRIFQVKKDVVFFFRPYISQWGKRNLFNLEAK